MLLTSTIVSFSNYNYRISEVQAVLNTFKLNRQPKNISLQTPNRLNPQRLDIFELNYNTFKSKTLYKKLPEYPPHFSMVDRWKMPRELEV